jgi:hypothetical protein
VFCPHIGTTVSPSDGSLPEDIAEAEAPVVQLAASVPSPAKAISSLKFKKAPDAPKRFKSAFIIFSAEKHKEIKEDFLKQGRSEKVSLY